MNDDFNSSNNINRINDNLNKEEVLNVVEDNTNNNIEQTNENTNYNKKNNNSSGPVIIMFVVLLLFVFVFLGKDGNLFSNNNKQEQNNSLMDNNENDETNKDNVQEENNDKDNSNIDDKEQENKDIIEKYLKYVPYLRGTLVSETPNEIYDDAYLGKSININNINKNILLYSAITNTKTYDFYLGDKIPVLENGLEAFTYHKVDEVVSYLNKAYNIDNSNMPNEIKVPSGSVILKDNYYLPIMGAGAASYEKFVYSTNYYEENDKLIIEEEVLFYLYYDSLCNVYANTNDMHKEINRIDTFNIDYSIAKDGLDLKKYTNKTPSKYKHTFKKINNDYVWYSTEVVENNSDSDKINYEIKVNGANKELYVNDKKVKQINADNELGNIKVKEFNDLLIVDEQNPGPSRRLFAVDKSGNPTEIDYKVSTYNAEFINTIDSYRIEGNNLYIKVNRQWGNGHIDWYCRYEDKNEVAEYEVKYEYVNGSLGNRQILNEVTIVDKYKNESCMNGNDVCEGNRDAVYYGEYTEKQGDFTLSINTTLTLNKDGTYFWEFKNGGPNSGTYTLLNNKLIISGCPDTGNCDVKFTSTYTISNDCSTISLGDYNLYLK